MVYFSLNQECFKEISLASFFKISKRFSFVDLNQEKIAQHASHNTTLKNLREELQTHGTKVFGIYSLEDATLCSDMEFKVKVLKKLQQYIRFSEGLLASTIFIKPSKLAESDLKRIPWWRILNKTVSRLRDIAGLANEEDLKVGIEFPISKKSSIQDVRQMKEVMGEMEDKENIGMILDNHNFRRTNSSLETLDGLVNRLYCVQISDLSKKKEKSGKVQRIFPKPKGSSRKMIEYLSQKGYRGFYSLKVPLKRENVEVNEIISSLKSLFIF